ncbi:hypothetical protein, partial [Pseudomonas aeruginosa]|uniref:hypothetical protein n=1 Tax=Pseudomonas aeruginosa TaxID=287 RepID=UPI00374A0841
LAAEKRLNDIDYCYASWKLLKDLEKNSYSRNECIRNFQEKANARKSFLIGIFALILPLVLWGYLLLSSNARKGVLIIGENFADFGTRLVGLIMVSAFLKGVKNDCPI